MRDAKTELSYLLELLAFVLRRLNFVTFHAVELWR